MTVLAFVLVVSYQLHYGYQLLSPDFFK